MCLEVAAGLDQQVANAARAERLADQADRSMRELFE